MTRDVYSQGPDRGADSHSHSQGDSGPQPSAQARPSLLLSSGATALLGLGIICVVGACFSATPWWPIQAMQIATSYVTLTLLGLIALLLLQVISINYVYDNRKAASGWTAVGVLFVIGAALFVAWERPYLGGTFALGIPRLVWLVIGLGSLVAGAALYKRGHHAANPLGTNRQGASDQATKGGQVANREAADNQDAAEGAGPLDRNAREAGIPGSGERIPIGHHFAASRWYYFGTFLLLAAWVIYRLNASIFQWYDIIAAILAIGALGLFLWGTMRIAWRR